MSQLLGIFEDPGDVAQVARKLRDRGFTDLETYSPAPFAEVDDAVDEKPSGVRLFTLIGGLAGVTTGYALTLWMANDWQIPLGGKPLGLFVKGRLPNFKRDPVYSPRFSAEEFGVAVRCPERDVSEVDGLMRAHGAAEVNLVEA
jgi:hypothetical protein